MKICQNSKLAYFFVLGLIFVFSCQSENSGKKTIGTSPQHPEVAEKYFKLDEPSGKENLKPGDEVKLLFNFIDEDRAFDSIRISLSSQYLVTLKDQLDATVILPELPPGQKRISYRVFLSDSTTEDGSRGITIVSDIVPEKMNYRIINDFPHDTKAFTQGFEYDDGYIYEGTGNYGESSLRKYELETGEIIKFRALSGDLFGEGITRFDGKVYQITYKAQVGFVYDEVNFELIRKIYYQIREGWGLTNNGKEILMSDGSNIIYFMDTEFFSVVRKIEVYDNEGKVDMLNELELVDGKLYANRYLSEEIVVIDPGTGKLTARIDMSGLLSDEDKHARLDVLNGIAYDPDDQMFLITGKYWPKIFGVRFY